MDLKLFILFSIDIDRLNVNQKEYLISELNRTSSINIS